jgi:hypothetical protein
MINVQLPTIIDLQYVTMALRTSLQEEQRPRRPSQELKASSAAHESQILTPRKKGTSAHHRYLPLTHDGRKHTPEESGTDHSTGPCHLFPTQRRPVCQRRHADGDAGAHQSRSGAGQSVPQHIRCTRQRGDPQGCENTYQGSAQVSWANRCATSCA